ncbi:MAG: hypothetical protein LBB05_01735 [Puniceicoccales bacterium]|jgi:hypothetical protein|nr:hypothetical protein [Puniceicoccales bacterium]
MDVDVVKARTRDVIGNIFHELGQMSGFIPGIGAYRAKPLAIHNGTASSDTLQHLTIFFVHPDGVLEKAGILSPSVLFSQSRDHRSQPIIYFSLKLDFLREFDGIASMRYGQEDMIAIIRRHFEALNDRSFSAYFEHCNRFIYHKAALLAGSIPGWVSHRSGASRGYRGLKGHLLFMMDQFLHHDNLLDIPARDLLKAWARVISDGSLPTLISRDWEKDRMTTLSFVRLWNCDLRYEYIYDMAGKFWREMVSEESHHYLETAKKTSPERMITLDEVRTYLQEYRKLLKKGK